MADIKYQSPVDFHTMVDHEPGPSLADQQAALPKRDRIVQICQSDHMFERVHALATILIINEKAFSGGLKVSEQLRMWQDRIKILSSPPWILLPILQAVTDSGTTWADTMTARPIMGADGLLTIALGHGAGYRELPLLTGCFGLIGSLFQRLWDQPEMDDLLETDDNFEIVASTIKSICDHTCRSCGLINRILIFMPDKSGKVVRKLRIDHKLGDTKAKQRYIRPDTRQSEASEPVWDKRQKDDYSWSRHQWSDQASWHQDDNWGTASSSSWSWSRP